MGDESTPRCDKTYFENFSLPSSTPVAVVSQYVVPSLCPVCPRCTGSARGVSSYNLQHEAYDLPVPLPYSLCTCGNEGV